MVNCTYYDAFLRVIGMVPIGQLLGLIRVRIIRSHSGYVNDVDGGEIFVGLSFFNCVAALQTECLISCASSLESKVLNGLIPLENSARAPSTAQVVGVKEALLTLTFG